MGKYNKSTYNEKYIEWSTSGPADTLYYDDDEIATIYREVSIVSNSIILSDSTTGTVVELMGRYGKYPSSNYIDHFIYGPSKITSYSVTSGSDYISSRSGDIKTRVVDTAGSYISDVTSTDRSAYPDNGIYGSYWYKFKG